MAYLPKNLPCIAVDAVPLMLMSGAYAIRNLQTDYEYIGITGQAFCQRWHQHLILLRWGHHRNQALQVDWQVYTQSAFEFKVLESCSFDSSLELSQREQTWIDRRRIELDGRLYNIKRAVAR